MSKNDDTCSCFFVWWDDSLFRLKNLPNVYRSCLFEVSEFIIFYILQGADGDYNFSYYFDDVLDMLQHLRDAVSLSSSLATVC